MRLDKFLKESRVIKRRTIANEACDSGRISVNGRVVKASYSVSVNDEITISFGNNETKIRVLSVQAPLKKEDAEKMFEYLQ